jgi:hypothetical protein
MRLDPFVEVDGMPFTATVDDIVRVHGQPLRSGCNGVGLDEMDYGHVVYRFQDNGRLEEVTREAKVLHLGSVSVPFHALAGFVRANDPQAFMRARFVISPAFGFAFDPMEPAWVTALARHCLPEWEAL